MCTREECWPAKWVQRAFYCDITSQSELTTIPSIIIPTDNLFVRCPYKCSSTTEVYLLLHKHFYPLKHFKWESLYIVYLDNVQWKLADETFQKLT